MQTIMLNEEELISSVAIVHCEATFNSFLSAIYFCYYGGLKVEGLFIGDNYQLTVTGRVIEIKEELDKAEKVKNAILRDGGKIELERIRRVFNHGDMFRGIILLKYVRMLFVHKEKTMAMHFNGVVRQFDKMQREVSLESHRMKGFVRFMETTSKVMYASISPEHNIIEMIMPHFVNRYKDMDFVIHDTKRNIVGMNSHGKFIVKKMSSSILVELAKEEEIFQTLWKTYFQAVNINERKNKKLQDGYCPKRYRKNMSEF